ncbi:MAG: hypothetical protein DLM59_17895 [Pseudonocardiales bacterium]|nr:MAG: hypothetical protein DLM59_17895 [Pseudonocardiales bacterium]
MRADTVRVSSVRTVDGRPSRLPRVTTAAAGLAAPGWTVYVERGPVLLALAAVGRLLVGRRRRGFVRVVIGRG